MLVELVEETTVKEKNNWTGERKTILARDDEVTLASKHLHARLYGVKISSHQGRCVVCVLCHTYDKSKLLVKRQNIGNCS